MPINGSECRELFLVDGLRFHVDVFLEGDLYYLVVRQLGESDRKYRTTFEFYNAVTGSKLNEFYATAMDGRIGFGKEIEMSASRLGFVHKKALSDLAKGETYDDGKFWQDLKMKVSMERLNP